MLFVRISRRLQRVHQQGLLRLPEACRNPQLRIISKSSYLKEEAYGLTEDIIELIDKKLIGRRSASENLTHNIATP